MIEQSVTTDRKVSSGTRIHESRSGRHIKKTKVLETKNPKRGKSNLLNHFQCDLPPPTLNRYLRLDTTINKSRSIHKFYIEEIMTKHDLVTYLTSVAGKGFETKPEEKISVPNPYDVLFPIDGMKQWPGNERFISMIEARRLDFLSNRKRCIQVKIAMELIEEISVGVPKSFSRFLVKRKYSKANPGTTHFWEVMDLESVMLEIGKAFRSEQLFDDGKEINDDTKMVMESKDLYSKGSACEVVNATSQQGSEEGEAEYDPLAALKNLCQVSASVNAFEFSSAHSAQNENCYLSSVTNSEFPSQSSKSDDSLSSIIHYEHDPQHKNVGMSKNDNSLWKKCPSGEISVVQEHHQPKRPSTKRKRSPACLPFATYMARLDSSPVVDSSADARRNESQPIAPSQPLILKDEGLLKKKDKTGVQCEDYNSTDSKHEVASQLQPTPTTSPPDPPLMVQEKGNAGTKLTSIDALMNEGELILPKGVTVRPSGKWQAQLYFAGQSRYVGVYSTSRLAAHAYRVVQFQIKKKQQEGFIESRSSKDEIANVFSKSRQVADTSVRELAQIIDSGKYIPMQTERKLLDNLVAVLASSS